MATIICVDCGAERTRCPSNTRYCKPCKLLRELDYWLHRRRDCRICSVRFAPINRQDIHCSACDPGLRAYPVDCVLHDGVGRALITGIPVCAPCMRAPSKRTVLVAALERGQAKRKDRNNATAHR